MGGRIVLHGHGVRPRQLWGLLLAARSPPLTTEGDEVEVAIVGNPRGDGSIMRLRRLLRYLRTSGLYLMRAGHERVDAAPAPPDAGGGVDG